MITSDLTGIRGDEHPNKSYHLSITVTRHGPKESFDGPLTENGKQAIRQYYIDKHKREPVDPSVPRALVSSPVPRSLETARIYEDVLEYHYQAQMVPMVEDERLSEGNVEQFKNHLPEEQRNDWFRLWYEAKTRPQPDIRIGREAIQKFSGWLLEQVRNQAQRGGDLHLDVFSHAPVMAGFVLRLEELLNLIILSEADQGQERLDFDRLFGQGKEFAYLGEIKFEASSDRPDLVILTVGKNRTGIPLNLLEELSTKA